MVAICHLGFVLCMCGTTHDVFLVAFVTVQNFVQIGSVVLIISQHNDFCDLAGNYLFMLLLGRFGAFDPLNGEHH